MKVTIVGTGALGSHLVQFLRNEEIKLKCIDFDRVEKHNTLSQFHGVKTVGKSKVQALQQSMKFLFGTPLQVVPHKLTSDNVEALLSDADLVIDCLDNAASRDLIQDYIRQEQIPCLHGALAADGTFGQVMWDAHFRSDSEPAEGGATCAEGEFLPFIARVAACLAQAVQAFLHQGKKVNFQISPSHTSQI